MADDTIITQLKKVEDLDRALRDYRLVDSWDKFREDFLTKLIIPLRDNTTVTLGEIDQKRYDVDEILAFLPEYFRDADRFFHQRLPVWGKERGLTIDIEDPAVSEQLKGLADFVTTSYPGRNPQDIRETIERIEQLLQPVAATVLSPTDEILKRLTQEEGSLRPAGRFFIDIKKSQSNLQNVLKDYDRAELEQDPSVKVSLGAIIDEDERKTKAARIYAIRRETEKELQEALRDSFKTNWITWLEQDNRLAPFVKAVGSDKVQKDEELAVQLANVFIAHYQPNPPSAAIVEAETDVWLRQWWPLIVKQVELLEKNQAELKEQYQRQLNNRLNAIFAPILPPDLGTGAAEAGEQPEEALDKTKIAATAKTQLAVLFTRLTAVEDFQTKRDALESLVNTVSDIIEEKTGLFNLGDLQALLEFELDRRAAAADITPADFQTWAQTTVANLTAAAADFLPEEGAPELERPPAVPPTGLVTPPPEGVKVISEEDGKRSVGELLQAQQLLVTQGLIELRQNLKQAGLNDLQIDEIVARNRETVSQQIWLEFLQRGGLAGELKFAEMANIWSGVVAQNTQRILVEVGRQNTPVTTAATPSQIGAEQLRRLRETLKEAGYDDAAIERVFGNLDKDAFEQLARFSQEAGRLSVEQRRQELTALLRQHNFAETDARFEADLIIKQDFLGLLQRQLSQDPPILAETDRKKLQAILEKSALSSTDQTELARLFSLVLANKYPPEVILHLNPTALNQIYEFLARQQKAMAMLAQQLGGRAGFINPFHPPGGRNLEVARTATVTDAEAEAQARDTLTLELTLSLAFTGGQNVNMALAVQQFYADPRQGLLVLANNLGQAAAEPGAPAPGGGRPAITPAAAGQLIDLQRQNFAALSQRQQQAAAARQAAGQQALMMAILSSGGNPALLAKKFLTDPQAREALGGFMQQNKTKILLAIGGGNLPQAVGLLGVAKIASDVLNGIAQFFGGGANAAFQAGAGFLSGLSGTASGAAAGGSTATAIGFETGGNLAAASHAASLELGAAANAQAGGVVNSVFANTNAFLASTSTALTPVTAIVAAVLGPMAFAIVLTFIVFSVIAGSLNQLPTGLERGISTISANLAGLSRSGCWPVDGHITDLEHPTSRVISGGTAIDIGARLGKPIYSPFAGEARAQYVTNPKAPNHGYGLFVDLRTTNGFRVIFAHMSGFREGVNAGQKFTVAAGEVIGFIGSTGNSTGPHLHYETIGANIFNLLPVGRSQLQIGYSTSTSECTQTSDEEPVSTPSGAASTVE